MQNMAKYPRMDKTIDRSINLLPIDIYLFCADVYDDHRETNHTFISKHATTSNLLAVKGWPLFFLVNLHFNRQRYMLRLKPTEKKLPKGIVQQSRAFVKQALAIR